MRHGEQRYVDHSVHCHQAGSLIMSRIKEDPVQKLYQQPVSRQGEKKLSGSGMWPQLLLFLLVMVATFSLSGTSLPTLNSVDASWQASIEYAVKHHLQFGSDIVFTYGPYGFLMSPSGQGFFPVARILSAVLFSGVTAGLSVLVAGSLSGFLRYLFIVWAIYFSTACDMEQNIFFIMACSSLLIIDRKSSLITLMSLSSLFALLALVKFTFMFVAVMALALATVHLLCTGARLRAAAITAAFTLAFGILWKVLGQQLVNIPNWLRGNMELSSGYLEAMALPPNPSILLFASMAVALFILLLLRAARHRLSRPEGLTPLVLVLLFALISLKQAFVRADDLHILRFAFSFPLLAILLCTDMVEKGSPPLTWRLRELSQILIILLCLAVYYQLFRISRPDDQTPGKNFVDISRRYFAANMAKQSGQLLKIAMGRGLECFEGLSPAGKKRDASIIGTHVGNDSVDVVSAFSWMAMQEGLNYRPRPVIQGYTAYTPYLQNLNRSFMQSDRRPDWMIVMMDSIDKRLPTMEDPLLFPWIIKNYGLEWYDESLLLFKTRGRMQTSPATLLVAEQLLDFGQPLDLSRTGDEGLLLQVEIEPTVKGRLAGLLYQRPPLTITIKYDQQQITRRFVPIMGKEGFLLNPLLLDVKDVALYSRGVQHNLKSLHFSIPAGVRSLYCEKIKVRLLKVAF